MENNAKRKKNTYRYNNYFETAKAILLSIFFISDLPPMVKAIDLDTISI